MKGRSDMLMLEGEKGEGVAVIDCGGKGEV